MKVLALGLVALALGGAARPHSLAGCSLFPADNPWNQRVDSLPEAANSRAIIATIGPAIGPPPGLRLRQMGRRPDRDPVQRRHVGPEEVPVKFAYAGESDPGAYPIPAKPQLEYGGDHHLLILDSSACRLYELFAAKRNGTKWSAGSGAIWSLASNALRPAGWTSADAAGLPILPGLARFDEVAAGHINHGSNWYVSGVPDSRWTTDLHTLGRVKGSDFEVVSPAAIRQGTGLRGLSPSAVSAAE